ncbi:pentatricopeptide repeat (PPR) superfamily protein [Striga asiatica]|uniref:Pentatricopeptide repeat (PPR) superfamily protein n=1 Tax=Striga asiatica TaxID=4170 RepID=A0A5A7RJ48_STRAF|nr:pentatricopeptide repeat (PPR) superfamily protein [Striga asiatica]
MLSIHFFPAATAAAVPTAKAPPLNSLDSCSSMSELRQHHARVIKLGLSSNNDAAGRIIKFCSLSDSGDLNYALKVFDKLPHPDAFVYNTILRGYLKAQLHKNCIFLYSQMLEQKQANPNKFTFPPLIRACCFENAIQEGKQVHAHVLKFGLGQDPYCQNNLIHMYSEFELLDEAKTAFDNLEAKDDVSWTTLMSGLSRVGLVDRALDLFESKPVKNGSMWNAVIAAHVQNDRFREAFALFDRMREENVEMDKFVAASMLSACTGLGALKRAESIYEHIKRRGVHIDHKLATTIIDAFCKCGRIEKAREIFRELPSKGISSWNCMIGGFAMHGRGKDAVELFKKMESEKTVKPDYITFVNLLGACAHSGLVEEGKYYFTYMTKAHGILPGMEHYGCLVDLLGRAGLLEEGKRVIDEMPIRADVGVLGALLGACKIHGNIDLVEEIGKQVLELEPENSGRYVLLANMYAKAGRYEEVAYIRKMMNDRGVKKLAGLSIVELDGTVHEFIAGGRAHPEAREVYAKVDEVLVRIMEYGYVPESDGMILTSEEENENPLFYHSEKLAIAYGLLKTKGGETIRVTKNLRVCRDCHEASKLISEVYDREIIVRDRNRFHHFRRGVCSCNDYW